MSIPVEARFLSLVVVLCCVAGCGPSASDSADKGAYILPPGDALPPDIDSMLFGSAQACGSDDDCPSAVCYYGSCVGLLLADQRWMQETMAASLADAVGDNEPLRLRAIGHLERLMARDGTDLAYRGRALTGLEALGAKVALGALVKKESGALADGAALALTRMGQPEGLERTIGLTRTEQPGVAMEALRALGHASAHGDAPLVALLETLNPAMDAGLLGAAVDGLQALGDRRAVLPLVAFMKVAPSFLHLRVGACLQGITGASEGRSALAWEAWATAQSLKPPPPFTVRAYSAEDSLGFPAP